MTTNEVNADTVRNFSINLGRAEDVCRHFDGNRHRTMEQSEPQPEPERGRRVGHPVNDWYVVSKEASVDHNYFRTLEVMPVMGGGVMLRDSWYENARPAMQSWFEPDMELEERVYTGDDGIRRPGYVLVRKPADVYPPAYRGRGGSGRSGDVLNRLDDEVVEMLERLCGALDESEDEVIERAVRFLTAYHLDIPARQKKGAPVGSRDAKAEQKVRRTTSRR